jgi:hypothetical protein
MTVLCACAGQKADSSFTPRVTNAAYTSSGPTVCIDEAHNNSHTAKGLYRPFAELLEHDGYTVHRSRRRLDAGMPADCRIFVTANGAGGKTYKLFGLNLPTKSRERRHLSAFTPVEIDSMRAWVERGGSLLLVADHHPYGSAATALSQALGVEMGGGFTQAANVDPERPRDHSQLMFSRENGLLGDHPIIRGRNATEEVQSVVSYTGQSLASATGTPLLILGDSAVDYIPAEGRFERRPALGTAQAFALSIGKGRVVVLGEAAALTAQVDDKGNRFGMQSRPGNQRFALNVMHWLSRLL